MEVEPLAVWGAHELRLSPSHDGRGSFLKAFQASAMAEAGLPFDVAEVFWTRSHRGVVRGLHFQLPPHDVAKVVTCAEGTAFDVIVDLRVDSPTYRRHATVDLSSEAANAVYVPQGCAHGFLATAPDAWVVYLQSGEYAPAADAGIHWESAGIEWPLDGAAVLSVRDEGFATLDHFESPFRLAEAP